jgi:hypothetical protein
MSLKFNVRHLSGAKVNQGTVIFHQGNSTLSIDSIHYGVQGPWSYNLNGTIVSAALQPALKLTNGGDPTKPPLYYNNLAGFVAFDPSGRITGGSGLLNGAGSRVHTDDGNDSWDTAA